MPPLLVCSICFPEKFFQSLRLTGYALYSRGPPWGLGLKPLYHCDDSGRIKVYFRPRDRLEYLFLSIYLLSDRLGKIRSTFFFELFGPDF